MVSRAHGFKLKTFVEQWRLRPPRYNITLHANRSIVGITGTNGKTTTAYLVASIPEEAGEPVAMTGTVEYRLGNNGSKQIEQHQKLRICRDCAAGVELGCPFTL
jgi:UDP-N-acetylmuramyl pentapeptide synthase